MLPNGMPMKGLVLLSFPLEIKEKQNKVRNDNATRNCSWYQFISSAYPCKSV
jgi:hypothetical protein